MGITGFTEEDEGKRVVTVDGEAVGAVVEVRNGTAFVDPEPGMFDRLKATLNWGDADAGSFPLTAGDVAEVTDDELRLRRL